MISENRMTTSSIAILLCTLLFTGFQQNPDTFQLAEVAFKNGDFKIALDLYSKILDDDVPPKLHYILYKRACCYFYLQDHDNTELDLIDALSVTEHDYQYTWVRASSYWLYGHLCAKLGREEKSLECYLEASKYHLKDSLSSGLYSTIGFAQISLQRYDDALLSLNYAISLDSTNNLAYSNRSLLYTKLSMFDLARTDINKALQLDSTQPYAYKHSALIYIELKEFDQACSELDKAEELGYSTYLSGNWPHSKDVEELINKYCTHTSLSSDSGHVLTANEEPLQDPPKSLEVEKVSDE